MMRCLCNRFISILIEDRESEDDRKYDWQMARRKNILDYKLREVLPVLGFVVLIFNIVGYLGGFLFVDFRSGHVKDRYRNGKQSAAEQVQGGNLKDALVIASSSFSKDSSETSTTVGTTTLYRKPTPVYGKNRPRSLLSRSVVQHSERCIYKDGRAVNDGRWYNFSVPSYTFYAYSAIVDDRESLLTKPVIRIIGVGRKPEDDSDERNLRLFCVLHYQSGHSAHVAMDRAAYKIGYGWVINDEWVREYVFTCPMEDSKIPRALSVVENAGDTVESCMPVEVPVKAEKKEDFAVCVQVAFDAVDPYRLTEWLELQWVLGVRGVGVYNLSLDNATVETLQHYAKEGYVELRKTDYIEHGPQQYLLQGSPVINDCFYRKIHQFHYVVVVDFDEVIIPKGQTNLRELVDFLKANYSSLANPPVNYIFYNNYYFLDLPPDTAESPYLTMLRYRKKAPVSPFGYSVKSIVNSQACVALHNHYCWTTTAQYLDQSYPRVVDPSIAVIQHYKKCHMNETECRDLLNQSTQDDILLRYRTELKRRVEDKIYAMKGHSI